MKKNDFIPLNITGVTNEGHGVGRHEGMAVFVPGSAIGDTLEARVLKVLKNYSYGKIEKLVSPSPDRITPDCSVFGKCGGCAFRHITYAAECDIKQKKVEDAFRRIGGFDLTVDSIVPAKDIENWRNKAQYPVGLTDRGEPITGFYAPHSHRIVPCCSCALHPPEFNDILNVAMNYIRQSGISVYDEASHNGLLRHIYIRKGNFAAKETFANEIMVCAVINGDKIPQPDLFCELILKAHSGVKSIILNINKADTNVVLGNKCVTLYGIDTISDKLCGLNVNISPLSFYQVNRDMAEVLYGIAKNLAQPQDKTVLDLYCGTGLIGLSMADKARQIIGVEVVRDAITDAENNARINGIKNARFICETAGIAAKKLSDEGVSPDIVILDPPRKGCEPGLTEIISRQIKPEKIVYISCDPATLARDCTLFDGQGYKISRVIPVDMFPRTAHVETVVLLSRKKPDNYIIAKKTYKNILKYS